MNGPLGKNNALEVKIYSLEQLPTHMYAISRVPGHDVCVFDLSHFSTILQKKRKSISVSVCFHPAVPLWSCGLSVYSEIQFMFCWILQERFAYFLSGPSSGMASEITPGFNVKWNRISGSMSVYRLIYFYYSFFTREDRKQEFIVKAFWTIILNKKVFFKGSLNN